MLKLNLAAGGRLELPGYALLAVMKPSDGSNPSSVIYDLGAGVQIDPLADQYGFVRKLARDGGTFENPIEVETIEKLAGESADAVTVARGKITMSRTAIVGRRDLMDDADGARAQLFVRFGTATSTLLVSESLDQMDGIDTAQPASAAA